MPGQRYMRGRSPGLVIGFGIGELRRPAGQAGAAEPGGNVAQIIGAAKGDDPGRWVVHELIGRGLKTVCRRRDTARDDLVVADLIEADDERRVYTSVVDIHR